MCENCNLIQECGLADYIRVKGVGWEGGGVGLSVCVGRG